jgi:hypothetical protein
MARERARRRAVARSSKGAVPLHLVSCVSMKLDVEARAKDLYISPWFRKARAYVTAMHAPWRILSAKYGLLHPDAMVGPYEVTLNAMTIAQRRAWAAVVSRDLEQLAVPGKRIVILAGARYREFLVPALERHGVHVDIPLMGLGIGKQLHWLASNLPSP